MMQKVLFVIHAAPYGSERCRSALRAALSLADRDQQAQVRLFLMSDATTLALPKQEEGGESLLPMLNESSTKRHILCRLFEISWKPRFS